MSHYYATEINNSKYSFYFITITYCCLNNIKRILQVQVFIVYSLFCDICQCCEEIKYNFDLYRIWLNYTPISSTFKINLDSC